MDLPAEFYLETVQRVFQEHDLPRGALTWHGETVRPAAIRRMGLLTVEGERDDICAIGQTMAALDLCSRIPVNLKQNHLQTGVGHYGVFSGRRWAERGLSARARDDPGDELRPIGVQPGGSILPSGRPANRCTWKCGTSWPLCSPMLASSR